jgi:hypothetical protein
MAMVFQRATLFSHLKVVITTPFAFLMGFAWLKRSNILFLLIGGLLLAGFGVIQIGLPKWEDVSFGLIVFSLMVMFLMTMATVLTSFDHLRYGGWTDDGPTAAIDVANRFADAVIAGDRDAATRVCTAEFTGDGSAFTRRLQMLRDKLGDAAKTVTSADLETHDYVIFRQVIPKLKTLAAGRSDVVAFVLTVPHLDIPVGSTIKTVQLLISTDCSEFQVAEADVIAVSRPEILT